MSVIRCDQCKDVPLIEIKTPQEYLLCVQSLQRMVEAGMAEIVFQTIPLNEVVDEYNVFGAEKMFHQFRCTKCGTIYGMLINIHQGGQLMINQKVFNYSDYPDKPKAEETK